MASNEGSSGLETVNTRELSGNLKGAIWMILSGVLFTAFLIMSKHLSKTNDPIFLAFWRAAIGMIFVLPIILQQGMSILKVTRPGLIGVRSLFGTLGFIFSFLAISDQFGLPLSQFNAISFSRALFVTLLAVLFLGEKAGPVRWGATLVGFLGVMVMVQPQGGIDMGTLLAIGSALSLAGAITLVKNLARDHRPMTLLIWANILSAILLLGPAIYFWEYPTLTDWLWIIVLGVCGTVAQYCYIRAMSIGEASFLAPMDYLRLPMAAAADWMLFQLLPGIWVWIGTVIIIGATLFITLYERRERQRAIARAGDPAL